MRGLGGGVTYTFIRIIGMHPDRSSKLIHERTSGGIIGAFYEVYNELGYGFLESIYAHAIEEVLIERDMQVSREHPLKIYFRDKPIGFHRCDMIVDGVVIVELKSTETITDAPKRQLRNYLAATRLELGMLLHFGPRANFYRILGPRRMDPDASVRSG